VSTVVVVVEVVDVVESVSVEDEVVESRIVEVAAAGVIVVVAVARRKDAQSELARGTPLGPRLEPEPVTARRQLSAMHWAVRAPRLPARQLLMRAENRNTQAFMMGSYVGAGKQKIGIRATGRLVIAKQAV
jgi:hypothetical protein